MRGSLLIALVLLAGCPKEVPPPTVLDGRADLRADAARSDAPPCTIEWALPGVSGDNPSCSPASTDHRPGSAADSWAPCISDDNQYHPLDASISSLARVAAFESIVKLLLTPSPSGQAFIDAKLAYTQPEGLDSRVSRREDEHFPAASKPCADMTVDELQQNADRCVGQARIQPLLNAAFQGGANGKEPLANAARIESALLWFLYVSVHKEATTCAATSKDCDSSYAYYTGGDPRAAGKGLARYVRSVSAQAHDRIWDGILAVRCWRDLDKAVPAGNLALRDQAVKQLDRALLRGVALLAKARAAAARGSCAAPRAALWASAQILGAVLDREARVRDAARAQSLREVLSRQSPTDDELSSAGALLEAIFPCP